MPNSSWSHNTHKEMTDADHGVVDVDLTRSSGLRPTATYPLVVRNETNVQVTVAHDITVQNIDHVRLQGLYNTGGSGEAAVLFDNVDGPAADHSPRRSRRKATDSRGLAWAGSRGMISLVVADIPSRRMS